MCIWKLEHSFIALEYSKTCHTFTRDHKPIRHTRTILHGHFHIMPQSGTREASHAGSWYEGRADVLSRQLDEFLDKVPTTVDGKELPIPKARVIIAP